MNNDELSEMNRRISARLAPVFREFEQAALAAEEKAAKANPALHKLSRTIERGKSQSYRHYGKTKDKRGRTITYCWACHRNVAGYFLAWREVETPIKRNRPAKVGEAVSNIERDQWTARKTKKALEQLQKRRTDALREKHPQKSRWWISYTRSDGFRHGLGTVGAFTLEEALARAAKRWPGKDHAAFAAGKIGTR